MKKAIITYYYRGPIERGEGRSYGWRDGYSEASESGGAMYPWSTKRECQQDAKARGCRAKFERQQPPLRVFSPGAAYIAGMNRGTCTWK